ncbi:MAG: KEOPS complex subunit Cgi121 [Candidatus Bathyarchaeota archaeon]|nr:KEOPS complex subunit Cgi121 [Candidatus Bathyarchaeota archaeon]
MLKQIKEYQKYILITGFRDVRIEDAEEFLKIISDKKPSGVEIQFFNAKLVATWQHLYFAALNALTAFKNKMNISKSLAMEILLYASAQRQIRKAMETMGIKSETSEMAVLVIGEKPDMVKSALLVVSKHINAKQDETVLELLKRKNELIKKTFEISELELETMMKENDLEDAIVSLVIERMALLATQR